VEEQKNETWEKSKTIDVHSCLIETNNSTIETHKHVLCTLKYHMCCLLSILDWMK